MPYKSLNFPTVLHKISTLILLCDPNLRISLIFFGILKIYHASNTRPESKIYVHSAHPYKVWQWQRLTICLIPEMLVWFNPWYMFSWKNKAFFFTLKMRRSITSKSLLLKFVPWWNDGLNPLFWSLLKHTHRGSLTLSPVVLLQTFWRKKFRGLQSSAVFLPKPFSIIADLDDIHSNRCC